MFTFQILQTDISNPFLNIPIKLWNYTKKYSFWFFAKDFRKPCMKLKFFCQFPNPWALSVRDGLL
jgi:hypothetical protein